MGLCVSISKNIESEFPSSPNCNRWRDSLSHERDKSRLKSWCNIFSGLSYNKVNNTFLNSFRKNEVEAKVEFTFKIMERARVTCYWCIGGSLGRKGERLGYERSWFDPGLQSSFFLIEPFSITGQKFSKCFKNGSVRLRKRNLQLWTWAIGENLPRVWQILKWNGKRHPCKVANFGENGESDK